MKSLLTSHGDWSARARKASTQHRLTLSWKQIGTVVLELPLIARMRERENMRRLIIVWVVCGRWRSVVQVQVAKNTHIFCLALVALCAPKLYSVRSKI